jgi:hypothetical protein
MSGSSVQATEPGRLTMLLLALTLRNSECRKVVAAKQSARAKELLDRAPLRSVK